jgi:hypothetical protein
LDLSRGTALGLLLAPLACGNVQGGSGDDSCGEIGRTRLTRTAADDKGYPASDAIDAMLAGRDGTGQPVWLTGPPELTLVSAMVTSGPGGVTTSGNTLRYDGEIPAGESVTILVEATIPIASAGTTVENQAVAFFDMDGDGENDTEEPSDDPTTGAVDDPTAFVVGGNDLGPPEIPTLSQWGAMLFAGLLSLLGLFGLRRFNG